MNQLDKPQKGDTVAVMRTSMGDISLRLFGNIRGEEIVMILFFVMAPLLGTLPIYALFLLGKTMQAFVFFMLTMFYIKGALEGPEH